MIHWGFVVLAFIVGFGVCYAFLYQMIKVYGQVIGAVERVSKVAGL